MSEAIVPAIYGSLGMAVFTIFWGILVEKYYVSKWSILINCFNVGFLAISLTISQILTVILLIVYAVLGGLLIFYKRHKKDTGKKQGKFIQIVAQLFGSKAFGSLSLAIALDQMSQSVIPAQFLSGFKGVYDGFQVFDSIPVVLLWIFISVIVFIIAGVVLLLTKSDSKKSKSKF